MQRVEIKKISTGYLLMFGPVALREYSKSKYEAAAQDMNMIGYVLKTMGVAYSNIFPSPSERHTNGKRVYTNSSKKYSAG